MLLVIPATTLTIVTTTTTQQAFAKSGSSRGQTDQVVIHKALIKVSEKKMTKSSPLAAIVIVYKGS